MAKCIANRIDIEFVKTYKTIDRADKAVKDLMGKYSFFKGKNLRYTIMPVVQDDGSIRYGVLFIGNSAIECGVHFTFNCVN